MSDVTVPNSDLNGATVPNRNYPKLAYITDISQAQQGVITFSAPHGYTIGEILGLRVSPPFGMIQLDLQEVLVIGTTINTVTISTDTLFYNPFVFAGTPTQVKNPCMAVPSSSGIIPNAMPPQTNLFDSFDNIPP